MFECDDCGKVFLHKKNYRYHRDRGVCKKDGKFKCKLCTVQYKDKRSLKNHLVNYHKLREYKINESIEIVEDSIYKVNCTVCGKEFSNVSNLNRHLKLNCEKNRNQIMVQTINGDHNNININNNNNVTNNNNYQLNFNLNKFGEEDRVPDSEVIKLLERTNFFNFNDLFLRYVHLKHVKNEKNHNLFAKFKHGKQIFVFTGTWDKMEKEDTFNLIKIGTIDDITRVIEQHKKYNNAIINSQLDKLEHENKKQFYKAINEMLYNNRKILSKKYEEMTNKK